jgi:3-phenylpropionate/trans-cinnamate dioxygenase ferredoxin subunit
MAWTKVIEADDVPANGCIAREAAGRDVLIVRTPAGLFAVENMCTHAYSKLEEGKVRGVHLFCPLHGLRYDLRDGRPLGKLSDKPLPAWPVEIIDGTVCVDFDHPLAKGG